MMKSGFLKKIEHNTFRKFLFFVASMTVLIIVYLLINLSIRETRLYDKIEKSQMVIDYNVLMKIENVKIKNDLLTLSGWWVKNNAASAELSLVLEEIETGEYIVLNTDQKEQKDVLEELSLDNICPAYSFIATIKENDLENDICYKLLVYYEYEYINETDKNVIERVQNKISTHFYLYNGELYRYNPVIFSKPNISDEEIANVIDNGIILYHDNSQSTWIYLHDKKMFVITQQPFESMKMEGKGMVVMLRSNSSDLLPKQSRSQGFEYLGVYYEEKEYSREGIKPYQVVVVDLDRGYPISYISTGLYDDIEKKFVNQRIVIPCFDIELE